MATVRAGKKKTPLTRLDDAQTGLFKEVLKRCRKMQKDFGLDGADIDEILHDTVVLVTMDL